MNMQVSTIKVGHKQTVINRNIFAGLLPIVHLFHPRIWSLQCVYWGCRSQVWPWQGYWSLLATKHFERTGMIADKLSYKEFTMKGYLINSRHFSRKWEDTSFNFICAFAASAYQKLWWEVTRHTLERRANAASITISFGCEEWQWKLEETNQCHK